MRPDSGNSLESDAIGPWEAAYARFESVEQERAKFQRRLKSLGAERWPREGRVLELFCGRGNGIAAWRTLGFHNVIGVDISHGLLHASRSDSSLIAGDARRLPLGERTVDIVCVQGGLHHLRLMQDLEHTLAEMHRVMRAGGRLVVVEPWLTPFLSGVHGLCHLRLARACWPKLDALATMIDLERDTYFDWLGRPREVLTAIRSAFEIETERIGWGKLALVARRPE